MSKDSNALKVREFHEAIGEKPPRSPVYPDRALLDLRRTLVREEYEEAMEALAGLERALDGEDEAEKSRRFTQASHELTDLLYVTYGALLWFGVDADEVFREIHAANMRKTEGPKRADGKQLKPEGWQPADVAAVLERLRKENAG